MIFFSGNHNTGGGGNAGFFKVPNDFPNLQELTGGFSQQTNRRRAYDSPAPSFERRRKRLLIALDPDYVQSQRLLSEKL